MINGSQAESSLGRWIRRVRREHDCTQIQLGGTHYSKSYISAVEGDRIIPSPAALRFFAEQLGLPSDYFTGSSEHAEQPKDFIGFAQPESPRGESEVVHDQALHILDTLLERGELPDVRGFDFPELPHETITSASPSSQLHYFLLRGLIAQSKGEFSSALHDLESALPLASQRLQPAILDALGQNYYLTQHYGIALNYALRALRLLPPVGTHAAVAPLQTKVEQHCGDIYRALGAYRQASDMYERARSHLSTGHDLHTAATLYLDLGYCTHASLDSSKAFAALDKEESLPEEMIDLFERAIGLFTHSRSLYEVSRDYLGEATARLFLARAQLDYSTRQRQRIQDGSSSEGEDLVAHCTSLLENAEEQCHQIMSTWRAAVGSRSTFSERFDGILYMALAVLVRVFAERARLAYINEKPDISLGEQAVAVQLCQEVLNALAEQTFLEPLIAKVLSASLAAPTCHPPTLPRPPDAHDAGGNAQQSPMGRVEVYCAAGEVAEAVGRVATEAMFAHDCYTRADQFFLAALNLARVVVSRGESDPGYLIRYYEHYALLLKERFTAVGELWADMGRMLLMLLQQGLSQVQQSMLPIDFPAD